MDQQHEHEVAAAGFAEAIESALAQLRGGKLGFSVAFEDAVQVLGPELLIDIDPRHFTLNLPFQTRIEKAHTRICKFFVGAGPWNRIGFDFRRQAIFREMEEMHLHGGWSPGLAAHRECVKNLQLGTPRVSNGVALDNLEKIDLYFASNARLLDSIKAHGVLRRPAFTPERAAEYETSAVRSLHSELIESDVGIGLGANGELYRVCPGLHRTAAAVLLGVRAMPVQLRLLHANFLRRMLREGQGEGGVLGAIRRAIDFARITYGGQAAVAGPADGGVPRPAIFNPPV